MYVQNDLAALRDGREEQVDNDPVPAAVQVGA